MKILIVDDKQENRYLMEFILKGDGHEVHSAANGAEAMEMLRSDKFDLIISDILMPVMDGFELCRKVKTDVTLRHIPFIIYTATYTGPQDEEFALKIGADRFILKPCEPDVFLEAVREVMTASERGDISVPLAQPQEQEILKLYNERLVRKLEQKMLQLEHEVQARQTAEEAVKNQLEFLEILIDTIPAPIYYKDGNGVYQGCNIPYAATILGLPKEAIIGRSDMNLTEMRPPDLARQYHEQDLDLIRVPGFRSFEEERACADSLIRSFVFNKATLASTQGRVTGMVCVMLDISRRKQIEQELKDNERILTLRKRISDIFLLHPGSEAMEETLNVILEINNSSQGLLGRLNDRGIAITPAFSTAVWDDCALHDRNSPPPCLAIDQGIFNTAIKEKKSLISNMSRKTPPGHVPIESILAVPILFQGDVIGILAVANKPSGYGETDRFLLEYIANQIAPIISARWQKQSEEEKRGQAEKAVQTQLAFMQQLLDSIPSPIYYKDTGGVYLGCNRAYEVGSGLTREKIIGRTLYDIVSAKLADTLSQADAELLNQPGVQEFETTIQLADGSMHTALLNKATFVDAKGDVAGLVGVITDINERKQAENELRRSKDYIEKIVASINEGIAVLDIEGRHVRVNPAMCAITGYGPGELLGIGPPYPYWPEEEMVAIQDAFQKTLRDELQDFHLVFKRKNGHRFPALVSPTIIRDEHGNILNYIATIKDLTEFSQLESQLRQAQKMEAVGQLTGGIAHDFNNLLLPILGYAELLLTEINPENPYYQEILHIKQAGEKARDLTAQLLAFSRKQIMEMKTVDLRDVITDFQKILRRTVREDIAIRLLLSSKPHPVMADTGKIGQILMNLAVNAQDAMPQGGTITIEATETEIDETYTSLHHGALPGTYVMLSFSDCGIGMDKQTIERLFEPFFTTKEPGKGTGLGLSTVFGIVKQHNGYIMVYSEPGLGTTFKVYLPKAAEKELTVEEPVDSKEYKRGTETVLVVEDDDTVRALIGRILRKHGYTVIDFGNAQTCLQTIAQHEGPIDLLLTDIIMPGVNGRQLQDRLSADIPGLKVIFMSGYPFDVIVDHGVLMQGINFISKPFTARDLTDKVRSVLDEGAASP